MLAETSETFLYRSPLGLALRAGLDSDAGVNLDGQHKINQDFVLITPPETAKQVSKGLVALIADGVSHADHAADASRYCCEQFARDYFATPLSWSTQKSIAETLKKVNAELIQRNQNSTHWLSTLSGLIIIGATAHLFHVGDTRIDLRRGGRSQRLTRAHQRQLGPHAQILTRAMGADSHLPVDYQSLSLQESDFFLLSSDGVHQFVTESEYTDQVASMDLTTRCKNLTLLARDNGSHDDRSCMMIFVEKLPRLNLDEVRHRLLQKIFPPVLQPGESIDGLKVMSVLHASPRSHLYLVKDETRHQTFTLKAPSLNFSDDEIYRQGFIREAWVGQQIEHQGIMKIFPQPPGSPYLYHLCEYIEGSTLRQWIYDHPSPALHEVRNILQQLIAALRIFKRLEIVHRDLKPDNVMLTRDGQVKLIDYGTVSIAAFNENPESLKEDYAQGSAGYMAPEMVIANHSSAQSDLFSLGVIAYEMLTGQLPYPEHHAHALTTLRSQDWRYPQLRQRRSDLPFWLDIALQKALEPDPQHRYATYSEFLADLNRPNLALEQLYASRPFIQKNPLRFWQLTSLLLASLWILTLFTR